MRTFKRFILALLISAFLFAIIFLCSSCTSTQNYGGNLMFGPSARSPKSKDWHYEGKGPKFYTKDAKQLKTCLMRR